MRNYWTIAFLALVVAVWDDSAACAAEQPGLPEDYSCTACHTKDGLFYNEGNPIVTAADLAGDIHWQKGLRCHDCHGGNPVLDEYVDHRDDSNFRFLESPADVPGFCGRCHADAEYMKGYQSQPHTDIIQQYWNSGHGLAVKTATGLEENEIPSCIACHGAHDTRAVDNPESRCHPSQLGELCNSCHQHQVDAMRLGMHSKTGPRDEQGRGTPMACAACHGDDVHALISFRDRQSARTQVATCGACHEEEWETYRVSVHGHGLRESGLMVTAVCADCHGAHDIYLANDRRSTLFPGNVADTCGHCHLYIEERLASSVHGWGNGPGNDAQRTAPGGDETRKPSCTDCHQGHDLPHPRSVEFRQQLPNRCGNCHGELSGQYAMSMHGELTTLGYGPAAKCSDCHGAHDILPASNPQSLLSSENREETCRSCHPRASGNFLDFDPHADHHDPKQSPTLYWIYQGLVLFLFVVFGLFGLHAVLWFVRSQIDVLKRGRPRALVPGETAVVRFKRFHRIAHTILLISFLGLALTGLPLKYSDQDWGKALASVLGGFESTSFWHRFFGLVNFGCLAGYIVRLTQKYRTGRRLGLPRKQAIFGPDSPVPNLRDVKDFFRMGRWFVGVGPKPKFERWTYWEKFDFWGATADSILIGTTGLILWFPNFFCGFLLLPGETLNVAKVIHSTLALLATGFVFAIHFFGTHFRPEKFPADMSILTGLVSVEEMREERPEYYERLQREGRLERKLATVPSRRHLWLVRSLGYVALAVGLALLAGILLAALGG